MCNGDVLALLERCYRTTDRYDKEQISPQQIEKVGSSNNTHCQTFYPCIFMKFPSNFSLLTIAPSTPTTHPLSYTLHDNGLRVTHLSTQPVASSLSLVLSIMIPASRIRKSCSIDFPWLSKWAVTVIFLMLACLPMRAWTYRDTILMGNDVRIIIMCYQKHEDKNNY